MNKIIILAVAATISGLLWVGDKFGGLTADLKGLLPAVTQTGRDLFSFIGGVQHPLILAVIVVVAVLVAYRLAKTILLVGAVALLLFILVKILPSVLA